MRALIHIGPPKTGTTSIQAFLRRNEQLLSDNKIACFATAEWVRMLSAGFKSKAPATHWYREQSQKSAATFDEFKRQAVRKLRAELARLNPSVQLVVFSSEGLFAYRSEELSALHQLLGDFFEQIEIITYLRRQDHATVSRHKNKIRNGSKIDPIDVSHHTNLDYWPQLQRWASEFGQSQIQVRRFPDSAPEKFDLIEHFQAELAERVDGWSGDYVKPEYRNVGWNWQASEYLRVANRLCQQQMADVEFQRRLVRLIDQQCSSGEKMTVTRQMARDVVALYDAPNALICETFLPGEERLFHDDFSRYPQSDEELGQLLSVEAAVQLGVELMYGSLQATAASTDKKPRFSPVLAPIYLKNLIRRITVRLRG